MRSIVYFLPQAWYRLRIKDLAEGIESKKTHPATFLFVLITLLTKNQQGIILSLHCGWVTIALPSQRGVNPPSGPLPPMNCKRRVLHPSTGRREWAVPAPPFVLERRISWLCRVYVCSPAVTIWSSLAAKSSRIQVRKTDRMSKCFVVTVLTVGYLCRKWQQNAIAIR